MHQEIWFQKYKILGLVGRGGTAEVYLAEHIKLKSYRAIKVISKQNPLYEQLRNEAFILKNLKHSSIPIIYDIEENEEGSYIVEEYLEGMSLKDYITVSGVLREDSIIRFGMQICDLIRYLHSTQRPILYIDLKPSNILVSGRSLKLIDFGSALYCDEITSEQKYLATVGYAAPELYQKNQIDERCDVYGVGVLLYYMVTGLQVQSDRERVNHIDLVGNCSSNLRRIINRSLKFNPSERYASIEKLNKQLSAALKKKSFQVTLKRTIVIAVAGSQPRIGVTHFSFRLCNYYKSLRYSCLYQEMNNSNCILAIKERFQGLFAIDGIYEIYGLPMRPYSQREQADYANISVIIQDFGCLTKQNIQEYKKADLKLLILGAKEWELDYSEDLLKKVAEYKEIFYLFNFLNGRQFQQVMKNMKHRNCYRIPFEPDPFSKISLKNGLDLFREIADSMEEMNKKEASDQHNRMEVNETKSYSYE